MDERGRTEAGTRNENDIASKYFLEAACTRPSDPVRIRLANSNVYRACESVTIAEESQSWRKKKTAKKNTRRAKRRTHGHRVHTAINLEIYCLFAAVKNEFKKLDVVVVVGDFNAVVCRAMQPTTL